MLGEVQRHRPDQAFVDPYPFAAAHQADALALARLAVMDQDVEALLLLAFSRLHQRLDRHREAGTVASEQEVIGECRQGRTGIIDG